jgi:hypothetical protein
LSSAKTCVRYSLLRPGPAQWARLAEIHDNLIARIAEAEREGWLGEVEGLQISLVGAQDKLAQFDAEAARRSNGEGSASACWASARSPSAPSRREPSPSAG